MRKLFAALVLVLVTAAAPAAPAPWVASWASSQMIADPANALPAADMKDATLRQVVRLSIGGTGYRLQLSNAFGTQPLHLKAVHVAKALANGAIDPVSDRSLTFSGQSDVTIPAGASYLSDPVMNPVAALSDLAISIHYDEPPLIQTSHPGSRTTSYLLAGDHVADAQLTGAKTYDHWYNIAAIEVLTVPNAAAVVALGDSITDGRGSTTNGNDRWTNILAIRLQTQAATRNIGVLNAGIGGNCILVQCLGPSAMARFERDVLALPGVKAMIVLEGINDLGGLTREHPVAASGHEQLVNWIIAAYTQMAERAHAHGIKAYICTILPYGGSSYYHPDAANEADRNAVNAWIRAQKLFDGVADFDAALRDPAHPDRLNSLYDAGDFLHPSPAGYRVMGELAAKVVGAKGKKK